MKRPVSIVASLVVVALVSTGCTFGRQATKADFMDICLKRFGNSQPKCTCFVGSLEQDLPDDLFDSVVQGAYLNRNFPAKDWVPGSVRSNARVSSALDTATQTCLT
jgi:hypothetical protein